MTLSYTIQYSQRVDLELYKLDTSPSGWENPNHWEDNNHVILESNVTPPEDDPEAQPELESFLGERIGYLKVYPYTGNIGDKIDDVYQYEDYDESQFRDYVLAVKNGEISNSEALENYLAIGFHGQPLIRNGEVVASLDDEVLADEPEAEDTTPEDEPEVPVATDTLEAETPIEPEATEPVEPAAPVENEDAAEPNEIENDTESEAALPDAKESDEDTIAPVNEPSADELPTAPEADEFEPTEAPETTTVPEETPEAAEAPADEPEENPVPTQEPIGEEPAPEETEDEPAVQAEAPDLEANGIIQNFAVWGGELADNPGYVYESGCYVIVLTPKDEEFSKYNSFLCFRVDTEGHFTDYPSGNQYPELHYEYPADPVNLLNGSFTWNYTDMSLYGKYDLPFKRYYESRDTGDHGLGIGWSTDYSVELMVDTLYAQITMPKGEDMYFNLHYDGTYRAPAGPPLSLR